MPNISVEHCRKQLEQRLQQIDNFVKELKTYKIETNIDSYLPLKIRTFEMFVGLQFLLMHLAWEEFLESVFVRYMCGCSSPTGLSPQLLHNKEKCLKDAMTTLLGNHKYLNWSPTDTIDRANEYLDHGEPFSGIIGSARYALDSMSIIRNRFAHRSEYAAERFGELVRRELGYNPRGMTPGRFLLVEEPINRRRRQTYLKYYSDVLQIASNGIAPQSNSLYT